MFYYMKNIKNPLDAANTAIETADKAVDTADKFKKFMDGILEKFPSHRAKQLFINEIENNPNLTTSEKMGYLYSYKSIANQMKNTAQIYTLADLKMKERGKSIEDELPKLGEDWLNYYNDVIKNFSSEEMQAIWASILASECENKGSISKKLISILQVIDKDCAEAFSYMCSYAISYENENDLNYMFIIPGSIMSTEDLSFKDSCVKDYYDKNIINFDRRVNLEAFGLIKETAMGFCISGNEITLKYCGKSIDVKCKNKHDGIPVGLIEFTAAGKELIKVLGNGLDIKKNPSYIEDFIVRYYKENGCEVTVHD